MARVQLKYAIRHNGAHTEAGEVIEVSDQDAELLRSCGHEVEADPAEAEKQPTRRRRGANAESEK